MPHVHRLSKEDTRPCMFRAPCASNQSLKYPNGVEICSINRTSDGSYTVYMLQRFLCSIRYDSSPLRAQNNHVNMVQMEKEWR